MSIRNNFSKYIDEEPKFVKRINSTDLPSTGDYDLKLNPKMKNNEIDKKLENSGGSAVNF